MMKKKKYKEQTVTYVNPIIQQYFKKVISNTYNYKNTLTDPKEKLTLFSINPNVSYGRVKHKHSTEIN